jgi:hypothetical protein
MRSRRSPLAGLMLAVVLLAVSGFAVPATASAARILYASGHDLDPARLAVTGGSTLAPPGEGGFDGCSDAEWGAALARTDFDVLMIGEDAASDCMTPLSATTLTAISNYVKGGKPVIVTGAHAAEAGFMNAVFGFNTTNVNNSSDEAITGTLQPGATGTPFAGGPPSLTDLSATELLSGTPGTTLYSGPEGTWAFTVPYGAGVVTYLGWDFCCGTDGEPGETYRNNWYRVLDRATKISSNFTIDGITRNKKKGTAIITAGIDFPGELLASGKGVKASSAGAVISKSVAAGQAQLVIKAKGKNRRKLNEKGKVKVKLAVTYTPTAGAAHTQPLKVKLKKKIKK